jgi:hypothetical protein
LAIQFGLNSQEIAAIDAAAKQYGAVLLKIKQFVQTSPNDLTGIASLVASRQQSEQELADQILTAVRPATADQLRFVGDFVAKGTVVPTANGSTSK